HAHGAVGRYAIHGRTVPHIVDALRWRYLAQGKRPAPFRIGKKEAATRATHHIVGTVETAAHVALGNGLDFAVGVKTRDAPPSAFAVDQTPLKVERRAVAFLGSSDELRPLTRRDAIELARAKIEEVIETIGMP